jgi:uncharacterized cupin superfamily protein
MPKIDISKIATDTRTGYPPPYDRVVLGRERKRLGNAGGLDQFGVNLTTLKPGASSALRHWHETVLKPGDAATFKANSGNGHHLVNRSSRDAIYLEVGTRSKIERVEYPEADLKVVRDDKGFRYTHKDGSPYE